MTDEDRSYYARRARAERELAERASCTEAAQAHRAIADAYQQRCAPQPPAQPLRR